jgi:hypothetical protein
MPCREIQVRSADKCSTHYAVYWGVAACMFSELSTACVTLHWWLACCGLDSEVLGTPGVEACVWCPHGTASPTLGAAAASTCVPCVAPENSTAGALECWPSVLSITAANPPPLVVGYSVGDVVTILFSSPTTTPLVTPNLVTFMPPIGTTTTSWRSPRELQFTVVNTAGVSAVEVDVAQGALRALIAGVRSASGLSPPSSPVIVTVGGTWGVPGAVNLVSAAAVDSGRNPGLDTGDSLDLVFDQPVSPVPVGSTSAVLGLLAFTPAFPTGSVLLVGTWRPPLTLSIAITFLQPAGALGAPARSAWPVSGFSVSTLPSAGLLSANRESAPSNSTITVTTGTWGDVPGASVVEKSSSSVFVTLQPPTPPVAYPVHTYVLQWSASPGFEDLGTALTTTDTDLWLAIRPHDVNRSTTATSVALGTVVGPVVVVDADSASMATRGSAVLRVADPTRTSSLAPFGFTLTGLASGVALHLRAACVNAGVTMGPVLGTSPPSVRLQEPRIVSVDVAGVTLRTEGGVVVTVRGVQVGAVGSVVSLLLSRNATAGQALSMQTLTSPPCTVLVPTVLVQCASPAGTGAGYSVAVVVDGIRSKPWVNGTLSFAAPLVCAGSPHDVYNVVLRVHWTGTLHCLATAMFVC